MMAETNPELSAYAVFSGGIDQSSVQRFFERIASGVNNRISSIHILFQSSGGVIGDGVCLYNFLRTLPIDITLYNCGSVQSIGAIVYLGAKRRVTSRFGTFMVHKAHASPQAASVARLQGLVDSLIIDDARLEAILREHLNLNDEQWKTHESTDLWLTADQAIEAGMATEIGDFSPPPGQPLFYV